MCRGSNTSKLMIGQRVHGGHRKRIRQKGRQRSSLLVGGRNWMQHNPLFPGWFEEKDEYSRITDAWRNGWSEKQMIILFTPCQTCLQIILPLSGAAFNSFPQPAATTFVFLSLWFLFYGIERQSKSRGGYFKKGTKLLSDRYSCSVVRQRFSFKIFWYL